MKIGICSDHRGFYMKSVILEYLEHSGYEVIDFGTDSDESVDFPVYAFKLGDAISKRKVNFWNSYMLYWYWNEYSLK